MGIKIDLVEKAFLGSLMYNGQYNPDLFREATTQIEQGKAISGIHPLAGLKNQIIYSMMVDLVDHFGGFDKTLLLDSLVKTNKLAEAGGTEYIHDLISACADPFNWQKYLQAINEAAEHRETASIGQMLVDQAESSALDKLLQTTQRRIDRVLVNRRGSPVRRMDSIVAVNRARTKDLMANPNPIPGFKTGITRLDYRIGGLRRGWLIGLLGNSNMGKSTAAVSFVVGLTRDPDAGGGVIMPTEMSAESWTDKLVSAMAGVRSDQIAEGNLTENEYWKVEQAYDYLEYLCIDVVDLAYPDISYAQGVIRSGVQAGLYNWAVVDSYNNLGASGYNDIYAISSACANGLHQTAIESNIPILTTIQAKPEVAHRHNKIPTRDDGYGGAVISQRCDVIISVYNHDHYVRQSGYNYLLTNDQQKPGTVLPDPALPAGVALFQVVKNRHKEGVNVAVRARLVSGSRFCNLADDELFIGGNEE